MIIKHCLERLPIFAELESELVAQIASKTLQVNLAKGESLDDIGGFGHGFHVLVEGGIKLSFISEGGTEKVWRIVKPIESFGEEILFSDVRQRVCSQALSETRLLYVPREALVDALGLSRTLQERLFSTFAERICGLLSVISEAALLTSRQRVIRYLLQEAQPHQQVNRSATFKFPAVQAVIASFLDMTPEHFSRILRELNQEGVVRIQRSYVHISCVKTLAAEVNYAGSS